MALTQAQLAALEQINQPLGYSGSFAIVDAEQTLFETSLGLADQAQALAYTPEITSAIGSVSKQFTAAALLRLVDAKALNLAQPLSDFFPHYQNAATVTVRQLLNMAAGLPDYVDIIFKNMQQTAKDLTPAQIETRVNQQVSGDISVAAVLDLVASKPLQFTPGSQFQYSNTNYALLGQIIEQVRGIPYATFMQQEFLTPLGMQNTCIGTQHAQANSDVDFPDHQLTIGRGAHVLGDGGIVLNLNDFKQWAQAILNQQVYSTAGFAQATTMAHGQYGFGWRALGDWYYHNGHILGYQAEIFLSPTHHLASVWLHNHTSFDESAEQTWGLALRKWHEHLS